jgi:hypothetical protein
VNHPFLWEGEVPVGSGEKPRLSTIIVLDWKAVLQMQHLSEPDTGYMGCQHFPSCQQENKSKQYAT